MRSPIFFALVCIACHAAPPATAENAPVASVSASPSTTPATTASTTPATTNDRLGDLLTRPDRIDAFVVTTHDFLDGPAGSTKRLGGYPIKSKLASPPNSFGEQLAAVILPPEAHRDEAIACALGKAIGLRFIRGDDVAETLIMPPCPSVRIVATFEIAPMHQLTGTAADAVFALVRRTFPGVL